MAKGSSSSSSGSIGFASLLTILFIALKLTNVIAWSWWWVLSPLWIGFAIALVFLGVLLIGCVVAALWPEKKRRA